MSDSIDRLVNAARKSKAKSRRQVKPEKKPSGPPPVTPPDDERFEVFEALHHGSLPTWLSFLMILAVPLLGFEGWMQGDVRFWVVGGALAGAWLLFRVGWAVSLRLRFPGFRHWRARLPYRLTGWQQLVDNPSLGWNGCWRNDGFVRVRLRPGDVPAEWREALSAVLADFARRANRHYYSGDGPDQRRRWSGSNTESFGSVIQEVARELLRLLRGHLVALQRRGDFIEEVAVGASPSYFEVLRPSD